MSFLTSVLAFVVAIAVLVTIHEFGHFWVARRLGVKVLRFSVGFGNPIWRHQGRDGTEYVVAAIPLGGYVKMLDEREGPVPPEQADRAFNRQPVWKRIAIVAAGPLFNFLFAIVAYAAMYLIGVAGIKPVIGGVAPGSLAEQAGLQPGMTIEAVDGRPVRSWEEATLTLVSEALSHGRVELAVRRPDGGSELRTIDLSDSRELLGDQDLLEGMGIQPWRPRIEPVLGELVADGPAARAGLQPGDRVVAVNGRPVDTWAELVEVVRSHPGETLSFRIRRGGAERTVAVQTEVAHEDGRDIGRIGALPQVDRAQLESMRVVVSYGPFTALLRGVQKTWDMSLLTLRVLGKMVVGQASLKNISGPLTIAEYAGISALIGVSAFLGFLGILSVSLGVLNLLPVPVLDGGHLLFYAIEVVRGRPLSEEAEALGQRIGLAILGALMFLAFYNDITRLLD